MSSTLHGWFRRVLLPSLVGSALLGLWFAGMTWATDAGIRTFEAHVVADPARPTDPQSWRASRFFIEPDSYFWLSYARDLRESGSWRLRSTPADNAPYDREMHWSHLPIWSLMGIARFLETAGGIAPPMALELAGRCLMPLVGWLCFTALFALLVARFGWRIAAMVVVPLTVMLNWSFHPLRPDHHGFQLAFSTGTWLCLAFGGMGWIRERDGLGVWGPPPLSRAKRWFIVSGLFGALGLWLGATVFLFSLAGIAAGAALATILVRPPPAGEPLRLHPNLWRLWGLSGAVVSLFCYAVEYAPHSMSMRLEANHPLYALCWLGTAECLRALASRKQTRRLAPRDAAMAILAFCAAAVLPGLILFGPVAWFLPRSELMLRLHSRHINEFWTLFATSGSKWPSVFLHAFGVHLLSAAAAAFLFARRRLSVPWQAVLSSLGCLFACMLLLYLWQIRWAPFVLAAAFLFTAFVLAALGERISTAPADRTSRGCLALLAALLLLHAVDGVRQIVGPLRLLFRTEKIEAKWLTPLLQRNLMLQLKSRSGGAPMRFLMPAEMAPAAYYFGVGDAVGSLYWENLAGLAAATEFFGDSLPGDRARTIARERGATHALMYDGADGAVLFYHLATGADDHPGASRTVGGAIARSGTPVPSWLRPEPELEAAANPTYHAWVPSIRQWAPLRLPLWIYRIEP